MTGRNTERLPALEKMERSGRWNKMHSSSKGVGESGKVVERCKTVT